LVGWVLPFLWKRSLSPSPAPFSAINGSPTPSGSLFWENILAAAIFLSCVVYISMDLLTHPQSGPGGYDMAKYFGYRAYWTESLQKGAPALWNPYDHLGIPFIGWPVITAFSPFNLLYFFLPKPLSMTIESSLHIFLAAFGTYLYLRKVGAGFLAGLLSGFAFAFSSFFAAWSYAGGNVIFFVAAWWPWLLYHIESYLTQGRARGAIWAAIILAFCFYEGHPQMFLYGLLLFGLYLLWKLTEPSITWGKVMRFSFVTFGLFTLLAAIAFYQMQFLNSTYRWRWTYQDLMTDLHSFTTLRYFVQPFFQGSPFDSSYKGLWGYHEVVNYIGIAPLVLFILGLALFARRFPLLGFFSFVAVFFALLSMGNGNPLSDLLSRFFYWVVPGFKYNRSPGRLMGVSLFAMACGAGLTLDYLMCRWNPQRLLLRLTTVIGLALVLWTGADLLKYAKPFFPAASFKEYVDPWHFASKKVLEIVKADTTYPRMQTGGDTLGNYWARIPLLKSFDNTTMGYMSDYLTAVSDHYDSPLPDLIGLKYLHRSDYFASPPPSGRWAPLVDDYVVNQRCLPRAYVAGGVQIVKTAREAIDAILQGRVDPRTTILLEKNPDGVVPSNPGFLTEAKFLRYEDNEVLFEFDSPREGWFFFSDPYFPGWRCTLDGKRVEIIKAFGAFRACHIPSGGHHTLRMAFRPPLLWLTLFLMALGWCLAILSFLRHRPTNALANTPTSPTIDAPAARKPRSRSRSQRATRPR
jgi:hypothetical protein